ncbi:FxDxF family PEP-CTERM protein [Massilia sp. Se16.2.3]|uniref:FxDxF family PEP-CTERM protein n=1 Tax=Massilia sp. Se16.2.3 TaxID=2709303 RepID=UPI0015FFBC6A|nr:FxDxF family PEP-CTERM protein [Massilia sp. Se16.2.3]QNA97761.1 hypothetical protein G4G31_01240 [Massilia sp. Se16.2.3]
MKRFQSARLAMRTKTLIAALSTALSAALVGLAPAHAQTIERTEAISLSPDGVGGFTAHFGDGFTAAQSGSAFTDLFTFAVAGTPFDAAASVTSSFLNSPGTKDLLITGLSLYRYDPATLAVVGTAIAGIDQTGFEDNAPDSWAVSAYNLVSGAYAVRVDGQVLGAAGGQLRGGPGSLAGAGSADGGDAAGGDGRGRPAVAPRAGGEPAAARRRAA